MIRYTQLKPKKNLKFQNPMNLLFPMKAGQIGLQKIILIRATFRYKRKRNTATTIMFLPGQVK